MAESEVLKMWDKHKIQLPTLEGKVTRRKPSSLERYALYGATVYDDVWTPAVEEAFEGTKIRQSSDIDATMAITLDGTEMGAGAAQVERRGLFLQAEWKYGEGTNKGIEPKRGQGWLYLQTLRRDFTHPSFNGALIYFDTKNKIDEDGDQIWQEVRSPKTDEYPGYWYGAYPVQVANEISVFYPIRENGRTWVVQLAIKRGSLTGQETLVKVLRIFREWAEAGYSHYLKDPPKPWDIDWKLNEKGSIYKYGLTLERLKTCLMDARHTKGINLDGRRESKSRGAVGQSLTELGRQ